MGTKVKICGLTCKEDISIVNELETEYAGFVLFYPKSKRNLTLLEAERLILQLKPSVCPVAVTVSPTPEQAEEICRAGFSILQVHGELHKEILKLGREEWIQGEPSLHKLKFWRAINVADTTSLNQSEAFLETDQIEAFVLDGKIPGNGKPFDWGKLKSFPRMGRQLVLAGGLTPENVKEGIQMVKPDIVDVSSGVERLFEDKTIRFGKDPKKAEEFVNAVRGG